MGQAAGFGVDGCNRFICFQIYVSCSKTKKYVSILNYPSFSIVKKCFSISQSPLRFFYTSQFIYPSSVCTHVFPARTGTQFRLMSFSLKIQHLVISQRDFFFFPFSRGNSSFLLREKRNERGIPEIPLPLALCLKYY